MNFFGYDDVKNSLASMIPQEVWYFMKGGSRFATLFLH
ncbi:Uncharacterised protein [Legionella oakridgensis]|nr:Uncharacterised protein [Legionella oakridgensis]